MFCRLLCVLFSFFFWPLCYLSFFDLRIRITPLISSNSSSEAHMLTPFLCGVSVVQSLGFCIVSLLNFRSLCVFLSSFFYYCILCSSLTCGFWLSFCIFKLFLIMMFDSYFDSVLNVIYNSAYGKYTIQQSRTNPQNK